MRLDFAITPCPNDTFSYFKQIEKVGGASDFNFVFHDIETLNKLAFDGKYAITKLSFPAAMANSDKYEILDAGAALGIGTGPVFVARGEWNGGKVAVPGLNTTAALLFKFWATQNVELFPMLYSDILPAFERGEIDAGVLIHEGRFVFKNYGLNLIQDLGAFWTSKTGHPVPLGCICIRKDFLHLKDFVQEKMRESIRYGFDHFDDTLPLVKQYARHLERDVLLRHITAFVNEYSYDISNIKADLIKNLTL